MKKRAQQEINNITINMDSELEALAKAFVENAMKKGYNATRIYEITREICRECREEIFPVAVVPIEPETADEEDFRKKAEKFLKENKDFSMKRFHRYVYENDNVRVETNAILEVMCAMYKVFKSDIEKPTVKDVCDLAKKRLDAIDINYPNRTEIDLGYREIKWNLSRASNSYWYWQSFSDFKSQYCYKRNTISEYILIVVWAVNNQ